MLSQPVPTLSQPQWHLHGSKDLKERYDSSPTNRPHWHKHKKEELRWPPGLPEACDLAFHNQDRLLQRGALDAAQCHRAFGQVLLRLFPQGAPAGRPAALLDRAFSESDQDLDGLLLLQEFHFFVLRGLQPILTGAAQQSPAAQAAALQSAQLAAQAFATQTKMPTPELTKTPPPEAASPSSAWTPQGLKDCAPGGSVVKVAAHGPSARHLSVMLQEYEIPEVYESLGSGAFGTVLKVRHTGTGELRACKAVQLQNGSEALKELVELEVTMLKSLDHLNLLRLFEAFRDGDRCVYLVTELCAGGSLAERLEQQRRTRRPMLEGQSAAYAEQMLSAASYCHQRGVLHRDLKPENVLFLTRAPDSPLKVIDFGLSDTLERLWQNATEELQDRSGALGAVARMLPKLPGGLEILATKVTKEVMQRAGTPHYMAPEVYEGQYGEKADVWSIGVMIFEMLTNRHPFYTLGNDLETACETKNPGASRGGLRGCLLETGPDTTEVAEG
ncbi:Calcium-dependent protein kinase 29 (OsCDPK29) (OsCPK29) [Durusdinium trenchii]|uniref:Calcium-dependent protein kinase 29 (OsCDPK29) (OsCPK29) n=1 Tax=Durusdinium trenchii TaxID=1381693 RepID=A0ABP0QUU4_9DINO